MNFGPSDNYLSGKIHYQRRLKIASLAMLAFLGLLLARIVDLSIIRGKDFRVRADENRIILRPIRAQRGIIFDRNRQALTRNVPVKELVDLPGDEFGQVEIEGVGRSYPFGPALAHAVGYVGEVSREELEACQKITCPFSPGDIVGKSGLEKQYDSLLRGTDGVELIEVDANGKTLRTISTELPISGQDLTVNLDANLSVAALTALSGKKGAAVALDPTNGAVLAMVSSPSFDPNIFQKTVSNEQETRNNDKTIRTMLDDTENLPLFNRAVAGEYPPGSIFKLVTAAAGLADEKISRATTVTDTGEIKIGSFRYGNWYFDQYGRTEGVIGLTRAIARSNDIFFYKVGEWVGPESLANWAEKFGLGNKTGIDLLGEADGLVPNPDWKQRQIGERWFLGNTYHMAIGQGDVRVTPLQAVVMASAAVTGKRCAPRVAVTTTNNTQPTTNNCEDVDLSGDNRDLILEGMVGSCSPGGVAFPFFSWNESGSPSIVACKTGTAQHGGEKTKPHAWIVVVAPIIGSQSLAKSAINNQQLTINNSSYQLDLESPKRIVLVVLAEESGEGSYVAAPVAKEILTKWFEDK